MSPINAHSVTRPQLTELIVKELMEQITTSGLEAGQKLPSEAELIERFGVSRTVVREALRELNALGIVTLRQGRPTTVSAPTVGPLESYFRFAVNGRSAGLWEGFELRRSLEVEVAGLAAERAPTEILDELSAVVDRMPESVRDSERWVIDDLLFHVLIAKCTGNQLMINLVQALSDVIQVGVRTLYEQRDLLKVDETYLRHRCVYEAIVDRAPSEARAAMIDHFKAIEEKVFVIKGQE